MIGRLRGVIIEKQPPEVLLEVGGVGYEVCMPMTCFYELAEQGTEAILFTHLVVREDAQLLYGFNNKQERALFRELIKVNGIGPKLALGILSGMSAQQFIAAIESEAISLLVKLPGVGKKTAERLIVEMKDRCKGLKSELPGEFFPQDAAEVAFTVQASAAENDAISALIALGYRPQDASRLISKVVKPGVNSEVLIREALRSVI